MNEALTIELQKTYKEEKQISEFKRSFRETEDITKEIFYQSKLQELAEKGLIRLASGREVEVKIPPKIPGKPWSEILKEIRE
ncbi:MAG: hypothetical protein AB1414_09805 [bacterium]